VERNRRTGQSRKGLGRTERDQDESENSQIGTKLGRRTEQNRTEKDWAERTGAGTRAKRITVARIPNRTGAGNGSGRNTKASTKGLEGPDRAKKVIKWTRVEGTKDLMKPGTGTVTYGRV